MLMRKLLFTFAILLLCFCCIAQTPKADSLRQVLVSEKKPLLQFEINKKIADELISLGRPDLVPAYIQKLYALAAKLKNDSLLMLAYMTTSRHLDWKTDTKEEIEYQIKALEIAEKKYPSAIPKNLNGLSSAYNDLQNYQQALNYARKALSVIKEKGYPAIANIYYQLGYAFYYLKQPDSALHYLQLANELYLKNPSPVHQKNVWALTGASYADMGNDQLAESFFRTCMLEDTSSRSLGDATAAGRYAEFLLRRNDIRRAKYYALKGLTAAISSQAKGVLLQNVARLRKIYEAAHQPDSAYYFANLELSYRDSLFNQEKLNSVQDMMFKEQVRQQEEEIKKSEEAMQRERNLQYALIALAVVTFVILFFIFSHSIIANQELIRFLGVIALLIVFEFINLYIHPYLAHITHDSPLLMLLVMVCIASLLVPMHHRLEHWITYKLVEKNKKIRLAAAKKTIAKLEGE